MKCEDCANLDLTAPKPRLRWFDYSSIYLPIFGYVCEGEHGKSYGATMEKAWLEYLKLGPVTIWKEKVNNGT